MYKEDGVRLNMDRDESSKEEGCSSDSLECQPSYGGRVSPLEADLLEVYMSCFLLEYDR